MDNIVPSNKIADDFDEYLAIANEELSKHRWGNRRLAIEVIRTALHLRGTLPPRNKTNIKPCRSRIVLNLEASTENLQRAIDIGKEIIQELNAGSFNWDKYRRVKRTSRYGPDVPGWDDDIFWKAVLIKTPEDCWLWLKGKDHAGYGQVRRDGRRWMAHRLAYRITHKNFIDSSDAPVCHRCDNPSCVNPYHLFQGTLSENQLDSSLNVRSDKALTTRDLEVMLRLKNSGVKVWQIAEGWGLSSNQASKRLNEFKNSLGYS